MQSRRSKTGWLAPAWRSYGMHLARRAGPWLVSLVLLSAGCARAENGPAAEAPEGAAAPTPTEIAAAQEEGGMPQVPMGVEERADGPIRALTDGGAEAPSRAALGTLPPLSDALREAPAVVAAADALASSLALDGDRIEVLAVEEVTWSDSSLGCPQPGMMYAQVLTPGYRVTLRAGSQAAIYHTDRAESRPPSVVRCDPGLASKTGLHMLSGDALDEIRRDLETRFGETELRLEETRVAPVSTLDCRQAGALSGRAGVADEAAVEQGALDEDLPKIIVEHIIEAAGGRHLYRSWLDAYVYCGKLPEPFAPPSED